MVVCKELKSACDFARPEKYCTGPGRSDNEQADLAEVEELTNTESTLPTDEHGAAASSHPMSSVVAIFGRIGEAFVFRNEGSSTGNQRVAVVRSCSRFRTTSFCHTASCDSARAARHDGFGKDSGSACGAT